MSTSSLVRRRSKMNWSPFQEAIFDFPSKFEGSLLIEAVAGSGKSTTLKELVRRLPSNESCLVAAFNRHIKEPLERDLADLFNVRVSTLNAFGFAAVRRAVPKARVEMDKTANTLRYTVLNGAASDEERGLYYSSVKAISKLLALRKHLFLLDPLEVSTLLELADCYDLDLPTQLSEREFLTLAENTWRASLQNEDQIDFDDQLLHPLVHGYSVDQFKWILVDEAQDLSPLQIQLMQQALRPDGRAIFCGDRKQAIYQFRGADSFALENIERAFSCQTLPLSICYRCPRKVVELAKTLVPQIEARAGVEDGEVEEIYADEFEPQLEDLVLCRTTAPLVEGALDSIQRGQKAVVKGRDIGVSLLVFAKKPKGVSNSLKIEDYILLLSTWVEQERVRLARRDFALQTLNDKYDTLIALSYHVESFGELVEKINTLFSDEAKGILFSTVHKAKGLEAPQVYIIRPDLLPHPKAKDLQAENNIRYVAITRAQKRLTFVWPGTRPVEQTGEDA